MKRELKVGMRGTVVGVGLSTESERKATFYVPKKCTIINLLPNKMIPQIIEVQAEDVGVITKFDFVIHQRQFIPFKQKKPLREFWVNYYEDGPSEIKHLSKKEADAGGDTLSHIECVHYREVRAKK